MCFNGQLGGPCSEFGADDPSFTNDAVGNDTASSIFVPSGNRAALFKDENYNGACNDYGPGTFDIGPPVGNDQATSIWVGRGCPSSPPPPPPPSRVKVCFNGQLGGPCSEFGADDPSFTNDAVGNDTASSIFVPSGTPRCAVQGRELQRGLQRLRPGTFDIGPPVGNDQATSIWVGRGCPSSPAPAPAATLQGEGVLQRPAGRALLGVRRR